MQQAVSPITRYKAALVQALRELGPGWHSRAELAAIRNKANLNPGELMVLAEMVGRGEVIEGKMAEGPRPNVFQWVYRLKSESTDE